MIMQIENSDGNAKVQVSFMTSRSFKVKKRGQKLTNRTWYAYLRVFSILWAIRAYWETRDKHSEIMSIILVACPSDSFLASSCSEIVFDWLHSGYNVIRWYNFERPPQNDFSTQSTSKIGVPGLTRWGFRSVGPWLYQRKVVWVITWCSVNNIFV